jgi:PleD family two-component response regulator
MMPKNSILLIDPFKNLLNAYRFILEEEDYLVETALNLKEAYRLFGKSRYSVIITEYVPPFETTDYMIRWVRKNSPETYIIMVTNASIDEKTYEKLFANGVDYMILKPYSPKKILVHIKKGLKQRDLILKAQELERLSVLEPTTKGIEGVIFNIAFFKKCLRQELKKAKRHQNSFSLLLIRMPTKEEMGENFDSFYAELVNIVRKHTREEDLVGRNNGEIGVILPETDQTGSQALIKRLSVLIKDHPSFESDNVLRRYANTLFFQSFTYPNQFALPQSLSPVMEEVGREYSHN